MNKNSTAIIYLLLTLCLALSWLLWDAQERITELQVPKVCPANIPDPKLQAQQCLKFLFEDSDMRGVRKMMCSKG